MRIACLVFALLCLSVTADAAALLKARSTIDRDAIELGDLWSNIPADLAEMAVMPAPQTGQRVVIDTAQLSIIAESHRLDWQPTGHDRVQIERVSLMMEVPVPLRPIGAGEIIRADDIGFQRLRADRLNKTVVTETDRLIGNTAKHALAAATPVRVTDLGPTLLVTKNGTVTVRLVSGHINVTMQAKSLDDGGEGDTVRVLNTRSNRILQGVVRGAGLIVINPDAPFAAN